MRMKRHAARLAIGLAGCALLLGAGCGDDVPVVTSPDREHGRLLLRQYGCGTCHRIPGVAAAEGLVGPPLQGIARRVYLAGMLPNVPDNMVLWISAPHEVDPLTAMPDLRVPPQHARDMAAYLYTLR